MSQAAECGLAHQLYPSQFYLNEVATNTGTAFLILTAIFYAYNIGIHFHQIFTAPPHHRRQRRHYRAELTVAPLSTLLAAAAVIIVIFATWPQPLEGAALVTMVLAQASALGWQDHDPERMWKDLFEKVPDVLAVVAAAYALGDGRKRYLELNPDNGFYFFHDPQNHMIFAYALTGACAVIGVTQEILVTFVDGLVKRGRILAVDGLAKKHRILKVCSFMLFSCQLIISGIAIGFGATTIPDGCVVFNITKLFAIITLGTGVFYSLLLWIMRTRTLPVA